MSIRVVACAGPDGCGALVEANGWEKHQQFHFLLKKKADIESSIEVFLREAALAQGRLEGDALVLPSEVQESLLELG